LSLENKLLVYKAILNPYGPTVYSCGERRLTPTSIS